MFELELWKTIRLITYSAVKDASPLNIPDFNTRNLFRFNILKKEQRQQQQKSMDSFTNTLSNLTH